MTLLNWKNDVWRLEEEPYEQKLFPGKMWSGWVEGVFYDFFWYLENKSVYFKDAGSGSSKSHIFNEEFIKGDFGACMIRESR